MNPPTTQEKLNRIQQEILKLKQEYTIHSEAARMVLFHLLQRQTYLRSLIEKELS